MEAAKMFIFKQHEDTPDDDYDYLYCTTDCSMKLIVIYYKQITHPVIW